MLVMFQDNTLRKQVEEEMRRAAHEAEAASRVKSEFLANMSHELRTPLHGIFGMLQLMQLTGMDDEQNEYVDTALATGRSLMTIINDVLDFTKMEAGILDVAEDPFDVRLTLDLVLETFRIQVQEKDLALSARVAEDVPDMVVGDEARLRQILFNLVGNAVKFTDTGSVELGVSRLPLVKGDTCVLLFIVADTGIGIPDPFQMSVFDAFTQVDGAYTRKYKGTGLGLGIVRKLVTLLGGNLSLESEVGQGTAIHFTMPVSMVTRAVLRPAGAAVRPRTGRCASWWPRTTWSTRWRPSAIWRRWATMPPACPTAATSWRPWRAGPTTRCSWTSRCPRWTACRPPWPCARARARSWTPACPSSP